VTSNPTGDGVPLEIVGKSTMTKSVTTGSKTRFIIETTGGRGGDPAMSLQRNDGNAFRLKDFGVGVGILDFVGRDKPRKLVAKVKISDGLDSVIFRGQVSVFKSCVRSVNKNGDIVRKCGDRSQQSNCQKAGRVCNRIKCCRGLVCQYKGINKSGRIVRKCESGGATSSSAKTCKKAGKRCNNGKCCGDLLCRYAGVDRRGRVVRRCHECPEER